MKELKSKQNSDGKYGFVDSEERWAIEPVFDEADEFIECLARVKFHGRYGFINRDGSWAIRPVLEEPDYAFSEGVAWIYINGKYGFINRDGSWAINPIYEDAYQFNMGVAVVKYSGNMV